MQAMAGQVLIGRPIFFGLNKKGDPYGSPFLFKGGWKFKSQTRQVEPG
jgi:hypothetical protein